jgi:hypothetical protein
MLRDICRLFAATLILTGHALAGMLFTIDTSAYAGVDAELAFDFIDGGPPSNTVTITDFVTNGNLFVPGTTGGASGTLPGTVTLTDSSFFNEYLAQLKLGTTISFNLSETSNAPVPGSAPDEFALYLLDSSGNPLITTGDPSGADASITLDSTGALATYNGSQVTVSGSAPEPATLLMLCAGLAVLPFMRRRRTLLSLAAILLTWLPISAQNFTVQRIVANNTARPDGNGTFGGFEGAGYVIFAPAFDGNSVVFVSSQSSLSGDSLWGVTPVGGSYIKLADLTTAVPGGTGHFTSFTPYGPPLVRDGMVLFSGTDSGSPAVSGLYTVPANGGTISLIADQKTQSPSGGTFQNFLVYDYESVLLPQYFIDRGTVVFSATSSTGVSGVYSANSNGTGLALVRDSNHSCPGLIPTNGSSQGPALYDFTRYPRIDNGTILLSASNDIGDSAAVTSSCLDILNTYSVLPGNTSTTRGLGNQALSAGIAYITVTGATGYGIYSVPLASPNSITTLVESTGIFFSYLTAHQGNVLFVGEQYPFQSLYFLPSGGYLERMIGVLDPLDGGAVGGYAETATIGLTSLFNSQSVVWLGFNTVGNGGATSGIYLFTPACSTEVTSQIALTRGGFQLNRVTHQYVEQITLTNTGSSPIKGPISMALDGLASNVFLANASGLNTSNLPGSPLITVYGTSLGSNISANATLSFTNASQQAISYSPRFFSCP